MRPHGSAHLMHRTSFTASSALARSSVALLGTAFLLTACGGGGGDDGGGAVVNLSTLSGRVNAPGGAGLPGVTVRFEDASTLTDGSGSFLIPNVGILPTGSYTVEIDGSTATATGSFPDLEVLVDLVAGVSDASLSQVVTLPDLASAEAGNQSVTVDAMGATLDPIALDGPDGDIELDGAIGTTITVDGSPASIGVDLNVTPVIPSEVPMPLPDGLIGSSFVTIQPGNGTFRQPDGSGLDVLLPNDGGLPVGALVDIWSFDHDDAAWVNRSSETEVQGEVIDLGGGQSAVRALGVITVGGWHTPAIPIDPACATDIAGRVVDGEGQPLAEVSVFTTLGQFVTTDAEGQYLIEDVAAYDLGSVDCTPIGLGVRAATPPLLGSVTSSLVSILAGDIVPGGVTNAADIVLTVPSTGCVSGIVNGDLADPNAPVTIAGPVNTTAALGASGTFSACALEAGDYSASVLFAGDDAPTAVQFAVMEGEVTTVTLQSVVGAGSDTITVSVREFEPTPDTEAMPVEGAQVFLRGTDLASEAGLLQITNASGLAVFENVNGPYEVTAWAEQVIPNPFGDTVLRQATTVVEVDPDDGRIELNLLFDLEDDPIAGDANLSGSILNNPGACPVDLVVSDRSFTADSFSDGTQGETNTYSFAVPSGAELDLFVNVRCPGGSTDTSSAGFVLSIPALSAGEDRVLDIDLNDPNLVPFDVPATFSVTGEASAPSVSRSGDISLFDPSTGVSGRVSLYSQTDTPLPSSVDLPVLASGPFANFEARLEVLHQGSGDDELDLFSQISRELVSAPTQGAIAIELLELPVLLSPTGVLTTAQPGGLAFAFSPPAADVTLAGFETLILGGFTLGDDGPGFLSGTATSWSINLREGSTSFALPPVAEQILQPGEYVGVLGALRSSDLSFDYEEAFTNDLNFAPLGFQSDPDLFLSSNISFSLEITE